MAGQEEKIVFGSPQPAGSEEATQAEAPKRKRGRPRKQHSLQPTASQSTLLSKPDKPTPLQQENPQAPEASSPFPQPSLPQKIASATANKKHPAGRKKKFALTVFDKDALKLVKRGVASAAGVSEKLGVGEPAVQSRFEEMAKAGLLAQLGETKQFHLTVKGYNDYSPDSMETTLEEKARKKAESLRKKSEALGKKEEKMRATQSPGAQKLPELAGEEKHPETQNKTLVLEGETPQTNFENREQAKNEIIVLPENQLQKAEEKFSEGERIDLSELLARGAPKPGETLSKPAHKSRRNDKTVAEITIPTKQHPGTPSQNSDGEKCVLCRTGFVLSVGGGTPKYGHCFCGAAYHKDCYEGVLETSFECIQCGKKLEIIPNKASLDEVKKIKDVFG